VTIDLQGLDQVHTLIWDLDGTLVDSVADLAASVNVYWLKSVHSRWRRIRCAQ